MKRRVLSMILVLCMIVGLLPAVAIPHAHAAVTTRTIQSMKGTDYEMTLTATSDGATVSYTKNQEITLTDETTGEPLTDEEGNPLTEWVQVPGDENDWNAKYYYNTETARFTLEMKGVKVTKNCTYAFGVNDRSVSTQGGVMEVVIVEDSYFENCLAIGNRTAGAYRWSHLYVTSQNGATLYVDNVNTAGISGISSLEPITINANLDIQVKTNRAIYGQATMVTINGGNLKLIARYSGSGTAYAAVEGDEGVTVNGGNIIAQGGTKAFASVPTIAEGLCYVVKDAKGNVLTAEELTEPYIEFTSYAEHTAGTWADGKTACTVCGAGMDCEHEYTETVTKAPTCTEAGEALKACSICGVSETLVVEKVPHTYVAVDGEVVDGVFERTHTCSVCGDTYTESVTVMSGTVTLFDTAVTVDTDATTAEIPEAYYWVNGEEGAIPVAATAADNWNYRFSIVNNIPTVTIRDADYSYAATFLKATYDGQLKLVYEGENAIFVPYKASSGYAFISYSAATNTAGKGKLYIEGAEDAVLNVTGGSKGVTMLGLSKKAYLYINGGTFNIERTNPGGVNGVIAASYGKVFVENCTLNVKDYTGIAGKHPLVGLGNGASYGLTITDSNVTLDSNNYLTLCLGVFQSNMKGVLYPATMTVNGDSNVKIINNSNNTNSTYEYNGIGIWGRAVTVNGGTLEVDAAVKAVHITTADAIPSIPATHKIYTTKDGEAVTEYTATAYLKAVPCDHATTEVVLEGTNYLTKCTYCGEVVNTVPCEHPETTEVMIEGTDFVTYCTVCGGEATRVPATALETPYTMTIYGTGLELTHYDIPIYLVQLDTTANYWATVQEEVEVTDPETGATTTEIQDVAKAVSGAYITQTTEDANEENYNAKLIWHTGDAAPTLYLRDFVIDSYNEELGGKWRNNGTSKSNPYTTAGLFTGSTAPLTIIVDGTCVMQTYEGIHYQNELTIKGTDDEATLTIYTNRTGIMPTSMGNGYASNSILSGNKLTLDVNLDITQTSWANATYGTVIRTVGADMIINGGNIITKHAAVGKSAKGIGVLESGNLYINGGYVYSEAYNLANLTEAAYEVAGNVYITGGIVEAKSANQSGMTAQNFYISGGELKLDAQYAGLLLLNESGEIVITGGTIESASATNGHYPFMYSYVNESSKNAQAAKFPTVTAPKGTLTAITAGTTKDEAIAIEKAELYGYTDKYMKLEFVDAPCAHENATVTEEIISDATCTQAGSKKVITTCPDCGEVTEEIVEIEILDHEWIVVEGKEPTCSETGLTEGEKCALCGEVSVEQEIIDTVDHEWITVEGKDPTCTEPGLTEGEKCANCGEVSIEQEVIEAYGHTEETVAGKAATCTETGLTDGVKCAICDEVITAQEEIPALGHTEAEAVKENETATSYDLVVYCATCKAELSRETIETACAHENTTTTVEETPATCVAAGSKKTTVTCECGEIISESVEEIPATGEHTYTDDNDAVCNVCAQVREMVDTFDFVNYRIVFSDSDTTHKNQRAIVYKLGDQTVADPSDEAALKAIDPAAETVWQAAYINKILITDAGNYVVLLKYNVGTSVVSVPMVLTVSADPKLIIDQNNKMTILDEDETHVNHRVVVYYLAGESVEDIYDTEALTAIDAEPETHWQKTRINRLALTEGGTYVLHYQYNIGTSAAYTVAQSFTVESIPSLVVDVNNMFHASDANATNTNHRVTIYNMGDAEVEDIFDETVVAAAAVSSETVWGLTEINKIEIKEGGNYIVHLYYNIATGHKRTLALDATLYERPVLSITEDNKLLTSIQDTAVITSPRATYYYFGENAIDGLDIYDATALKAAATSVSSTYWTQSTIHKVTLKDRGNYVVHLDYNAKVEGNSYKRTVAIATTVYDLTKPTIVEDENNMLVAANENVDATNFRATIYNLGTETVEDPSDETALKAIDSAAVTKWGLSAINKTQLDAANNYVIILKYNVGSATKTVVLEVTR